MAALPGDGAEGENAHPPTHSHAPVARQMLNHRTGQSAVTMKRVPRTPTVALGVFTSTDCGASLPIFPDE